MRIDDVIGGKILWQKTNYFAKLKPEKGLEKSGVMLPPPPPFVLPHHEASKGVTSKLA